MNTIDCENKICKKWFVVASDKLKDNFIHLFSLKDFQEEGKFVFIGRGPGEFLIGQPFPIDKHSFAIFDVNRFAVTKFELKRKADSVEIKRISDKNIIQNEKDLQGGIVDFVILMITIIWLFAIINRMNFLSC